MFLNPRQILIHRLKKASTTLAGGMLFGAAILAFCLMAISHEFTKSFMALGLVSGILWWIADAIYRNIQTQRAEEARKAFEKDERKRTRRKSLKLSVSHRHRPSQPTTLFDYDKQG